MADNASILAIAVPEIDRDENCELTAYPDPLSPLAKARTAGEPEDGLSGDPWTCGWGSTGDDIGPDTVWTQAEADSRRDCDLQDILTSLNVRLPWWRQLDAVRAAVLVNMAYELGVHGLLGFHQMLTAVQAGNWALAASDMDFSKWEKQVPNREGRLAAQMRTGIAQ